MKTAVKTAGLFLAVALCVAESDANAGGIIGRGRAWNLSQSGKTTSLMGNFVMYRGGNNKFGWYARIFLGGGRYIDAAKESQTGDTEVFSWVLYSEVRLRGPRDSRSQVAYAAGQFIVKKSTGFGWSRNTHKKIGGRWYKSVSSWRRVRFTK